MPALSTTYTNYSSSNTQRYSTTTGFSLLRPYTSTSSSLPYKSKSSYDLANSTPHRSSISSTYSSSSSTSSSKLSPSYSSSEYSYSSYNRPISGTSGLSSSPSSVTLTRYNQRRSSLDFNDDLYSTNKYSSSSFSPSILRRRDKYILRQNNDNDDGEKVPVAGLTNLGNTCYMNSVLQALYATQPLREFILDNGDLGGPLCSALARLFREMKNSSRPLNPSPFRSQFIHYQPKFRGYDQQDAQEFLRYLINGLHDEVNRVKRRPKIKFAEPKSATEAWKQYKEAIDDSQLIELFVGQFSSVIKCTVCNNASTCFDPFWDLSLPIPQDRGKCDIEKCIREFTAREILDDDEQPFCSNCKKPRRSTKQLSIQRCPPLLILHLKKFANDGYKLSCPNFEVNRTISIDSKTYSLYACVSHHGFSSRSGHYTAYCQYDSKWFHCNDDRVTDVTRTFQPSELGDAYVLFYQLRNNTYTSRL